MAQDLSWVNWLQFTIYWYFRYDLVISRTEHVERCKLWLDFGQVELQTQEDDWQIMIVTVSERRTYSKSAGVNGSWRCSDLFENCRFMLKTHHFTVYTGVMIRRQIGHFRRPKPVREERGRTGPTKTRNRNRNRNRNGPEQPTNSRNQEPAL